MAQEEIDLVDEIFGALPDAAPIALPDAAPIALPDAAPIALPDAAPIALPDAAPIALPDAAAGQRGWGAAKIALAFAVGALASLVLVAAIAQAAFSVYSNRVVPGVHVGSVDVSGLSRDQVIDKLRPAYAYLGQGQVTVTTPTGKATITYQQAGRGPDLDFMADAAMRVGHTGNSIGDAVYMFRSAVAGQSVPIVARMDPAALAIRIGQVAGTSKVLPRDAQATVQGGAFAVQPSTPGSSVDAAAISNAVIDRLTQPNAPADFEVGGAVVALQPYVSDKDAQNAMAQGERMGVAVSLVWGGGSQTQSSGASPGQSASPSQTPIKARTLTVDAQMVRSWIVFRANADGRYAATAEPGRVQAYLSGLSEKVAIQPVEPTVGYNASGQPTSLKAGKDGSGIDVAATAQAIVAHLDSLAAGGNPGTSVAVVTVPIPPRVTLDSLRGMVIIGKGTWTTIFYPDISNGFGANIRTPANLLNGQIVAPGQQFSFLQAVSPVDRAHGYTLGGVIKDGKSDHTGAMGGGICSASTTMFNAAARAGLQIDERHAHFYYIYRYPTGLDATVFSNGNQVWDLKWTNDTPNPIVIRAYTTYGANSSITIQLWSLPLDRKVSFSPEFKANVIQPGDRRVYVSSLRPGQQSRAEYPTVGFDTSRTRTVTDSAGNLIHTDTWASHYTKVDGLLEIGRSSAPPPAPKPSPGAPTPTPPAPTPAPASPATLATETTPAAPTQTPHPRRRRAR